MLPRSSRRLFTPRSTCSRRSSATSSTPTSTHPQHSALRTAFLHIQQRPIEYASIPCVAAFVGITTNWMGVKMLFYPIEYFGTEMYREKDTPYGLFGWQGVVPTKSQMMGDRLTTIVTQRLLSLEEAFGRMDATELAQFLQPAVEDVVRNDCGEYWYRVLKPLLPFVLPYAVANLQKEITNVLDLRAIVMTSFVRDKQVLVDLFQKVGRVELEFLVNSGFGLGFGLGLLQMLGWAATPRAWTLPVAGALVGYVTNWIAIKLLFEPAEPVHIGPLVVQGMFESRQVQVSDEFGGFMEERVLNSEQLLEALAKDGDDGELFKFLRRQLPYPIPAHIISAAVKAVQLVAKEKEGYPELHAYVTDKIDISETLASRLKLLSPTDFEDLLHPVFQEDEITLIATGGILGLVAGMAQTRLGWGGPAATRKALATIAAVLVSSAALYGSQKVEEKLDEQVPSKTPTAVLQRRVTVVRVEPY
ncbi:expressed unknown protein [Seminavis robusta]|uniref:Uncharacterized protein n=1 Tax=Seminavis robusta TaxID=568900 RepID=A0A9N8EC94_9STRA|nr:expressed unknown protein [Seminavis robusta]|eukprot:Sro744_g196270.1 n/a (474) ;mRNA; f:44365-45786